MNIEETKEAIRVMQAFVDGKDVEQKNNHHLTNALPLWNPAPSPAWNWGDDIKKYRTKPTPVLRPWTANEVPLGAWLRYKNNYKSVKVLIVSTQEKGLCGYNTDFPFSYLLSHMEHSIDGGKTWLPCGVMEESK